MTARLLASAALATLLVVTPASAAGLDLAVVPADAKWVIHLDLEAARRTELGRELNRHLVQDEQVQKKLDGLKQEIGLDLSRDVVSITAYDNRYGRRGATIIIQVVALDHDRLLDAFVKKHPDHEVAEHGDYKIYGWTMLKGHPAEHQVAGSVRGSTVILSRDAQRIAAALDLLDSEGPAISKDSLLAADVADGTVLMIRGIHMGGTDTPFRSTMARQASSVAISAGQAHGNAFLSATMNAESAEAAEKCQKMIEGFRAMASLHADQDETAQQILKGLVVKTDDKTVSAEWRVANDIVQTAVKDAINRRQKDKKNDRSTNKQSTTIELPLNKNGDSPASAGEQ